MPKNDTATWQTFIEAYDFADDKIYIWGGVAFIFVEFLLCFM